MPYESMGLKSLELPPANAGGFSNPRMEDAFKKWHGMWALQTGNSKHPDSDPNYDWRAAFLAGARPTRDKNGDWVWPGDFVSMWAEKGQRTANPNWSGSTPPTENAPWTRPNVPYPLAPRGYHSGLPYSI